MVLTTGLLNSIAVKTKVPSVVRIEVFGFLLRKLVAHTYPDFLFYSYIPILLFSSKSNVVSLKSLIFRGKRRLFKHIMCLTNSLSSALVTPFCTATHQSLTLSKRQCTEFDTFRIDSHEQLHCYLVVAWNSSSSCSCEPCQEYK